MSNRASEIDFGYLAIVRSKGRTMANWAAMFRSV